MEKQHIFSQQPADDLSQPEYRALSPLAIIAFLLGAASSLALLSLLLLVIPLLAIVAAIAALRKISANPGLTGRRVALAGIALALLFTAWKPVHLAARNARLNHDAQIFSTAWLHLLQEGRYYEAHQWALPFSSRHSSSQELEKVYLKEARLAHEFDEFYGDWPFDVHAQNSPKLTFDYLDGAIVGTKRGGAETIVQRYRIHFQNDGASHSKTIVLTSKRDAFENNVDWQLDSVKTESVNTDP